MPVVKEIMFPNKITILVCQQLGVKFPPMLLKHAGNMNKFHNVASEPFVRKEAM